MGGRYWGCKIAIFPIRRNFPRRVFLRQTCLRRIFLEPYQQTLNDEVKKSKIVWNMYDEGFPGQNKLLQLYQFVLTFIVIVVGSAELRY